MKSSRCNLFMVFIIICSFMVPQMLSAAIPAAERAALIALYNSTDGDNWTDNSGWKTPPLAADGFALPGTEDSWYGVIIFFNANVGRLDLNNNQLSGSIPPELGNLASLQRLELQENQLSGSIPPELGNLANLTTLDLNNNQLSGSIPPELGNLANLEYLQLLENQLSGSIPPELGNLANLTTLDLHDNQLSGSIPPELGNLENLTWLKFYYNQLSGSIPPELANLASLTYLDLSANQLSGSIPPELVNLTSLTDLLLDGNQLSGSIPPELANLANLQSLVLWGNQLSGSIPPELGNLANLWNLDLSANQLSGSIPPELGNLANLWNLELLENQLSGSIPPELGNLANLEYLQLQENQLSGSIPPELGNLASLRKLMLQENHLSGSIPPELGNLANLYSFELAGNMFSGSIPVELMNLTGLWNGYLDFRYNALHTDNAALRTFLNSKQDGGDWETSQTVAPTGVTVTNLTPNSLTLNWDQVTNTTLAGDYEVWYNRAGSGWVYYGSTADKLTTSMPVTGLDSGIQYEFVVKTKSDPHASNVNTVISDPSDPPVSVFMDPSLPVELAAFTAELQDNRILLEWRTESEIDNLGFILERSCLEAGDEIDERATQEWEQIASYQTHSELRGRGTSSEHNIYTFTDDRVEPDMMYLYRLSSVDIDGSLCVYDQVQIRTRDAASLPELTALEAAYPNPFNPETRIVYHLADAGWVEVAIYDMLGRKIKTLVDAQQPAGSYTVRWNGLDELGKASSSGMYIVHMRSSGQVFSHKVSLIK